MSSSYTPRTDAQKRGDFVHINFARELERENAELRNEIARLNNQTNWVCKCGGTDCEGQKENAALRADKERLDWLDHNAIPWTWVSPEKIDGLGPIVVTWKSNRTLRAAIDAARKEAQP